MITMKSFQDEQYYFDHYDFRIIEKSGDMRNKINYKKKIEISMTEIIM